MYGREKKIIGGKISILKYQTQAMPLEENIISKKVEDVSQHPLANVPFGLEKVIVNNNLETRRNEPLKKVRNEKIMKFINFQI